MNWVLMTIILSALFFTPSVHASQFSFSQSPQSHEVMAKPGSTVILPYTLTNVGDPSVMQLQIYALSVKDSQGSYEIIPHYSDNPEKIQFYLNNSLHSLQEPFFMNTSEAISYEIAIQVPENVREGDYYFAVVGQTEQNEGFVDTSTVFLQGGVGSIIYLSVSSDGSLNQAGNITQFGVQSNHSIVWGNTEYRIFDSFADIPIVLSVANTGVNYFQAKGTVSVRPILFGSGSFIIDLVPAYLLSDSSKVMLSTKSSNRSNTATIQAPFIGVFTAQAVVNVGTSAHTQISNISYLVFPFMYVLYFVGAVLFTATGMVFMKRMRSE